MAKQKATLCWLITLVSLITALIIAGCSGGSAGTSALGPLGTGSTTGATSGAGSTGTGTGTTGGSGSTSGSTGASTGSGTTTGTSGSGTTTGSSGSGTTTGSTSGGTGTTTGTTSGGTTTGGGTGSTPPPAGPGPVIVVLEENHDYSSVIGNSAMPYLNGLAQQYGLATQYYANTHPSINNYFEITAGNDQIAQGSDPDAFAGPTSVDNIAKHLISAGKTWKEYSENIPSVGYTGGDAPGYTQHHNPFSYFSDVRASNAQLQNLVSVDQFTSDFSNGQLPTFSFVVPSNDNNAHDGTLSQADSWLKQKIDPVLATPQFKQNGLLIIVFDEAETDNSHGGGRVAMVMVGPRVKQGYKSTTFYQHQDLLKMIATYIGIDGNIGDAAGASDMSEFFNQ